MSHHNHHSHHHHEHPSFENPGISKGKEFRVVTLPQKIHETIKFRRNSKNREDKLII